MFRKAKLGYSWDFPGLPDSKAHTLWVLIPIRSLLELRISQLYGKREHSYSYAILSFLIKKFYYGSIKKSVNNANLTYCIPSILRLPPPSNFSICESCVLQLAVFVYIK